MECSGGVSGGRCGLRDPRWNGFRRLRRIGSGNDAVVGGSDLAQLDELLAAPQVAADLGAQRLGKEARDLLAQLAARRAERRVEDDFGAASARGGAESHLARRVE